jgi:hypothetical protein
VRLKRTAVADQRPPPRLIRHRVDHRPPAVVGVEGVEPRQRRQRMVDHRRRVPLRQLRLAGTQVDCARLHPEDRRRCGFRAVGSHPTSTVTSAVVARSGVLPPVVDGAHQHRQDRKPFPGPRVHACFAVALELAMADLLLPDRAGNGSLCPPARG